MKIHMQVWCFIGTLWRKWFVHWSWYIVIFFINSIYFDTQITL